MSVMAHEMGHIELGHCFNAVKFELLARKTHEETLGKIADFAVPFLLHPSFSKTQENESDEYAYNLMIESQYDLKENTPRPKDEFEVPNFKFRVAS